MFQQNALYLVNTDKIYLKRFSFLAMWTKSFEFVINSQTSCNWSDTLWHNKVTWLYIRTENYAVEKYIVSKKNTTFLYVTLKWHLDTWIYKSQSFEYSVFKKVNRLNLKLKLNASYDTNFIHSFFENIANYHFIILWLKHTKLYLRHLLYCSYNMYLVHY